MKKILIILLLLQGTFVAQRKEIVAYYPGYHSRYQINYAKELERIGSADKITVIDYAFAVPLPDSSGDIIPRFGSPYSSYQEIYSSELSIDGVADSSNQPLRGQLNQLRKLKQRHPNIRVMLSFGGYGGSKYFSDLALTPESREKFVNKCIDLFINGNLPVENNAGLPAGQAGGIGSAEGVFDGFDIDWEFPISGGPEGTHYNSNDRENMSALFKLFREKLDSINPKLLLTTAVSARRWEFWKYNFTEDQKYLDWFNVMSYDYHGSWDSITGHHANLLSSPKDPDPNKESLDHTIKYLLDTVHVSSYKIVPGAAFYCKGWIDVDSVNGGLYQSSKNDSERNYFRIKNYLDYSDILKKGYLLNWDDMAMAPWLYSPSEKKFWTYDDIRSIALKQHYVEAYNLRGLMFWQVMGDDSSGTLVNTIYSGNMPDVSSLISNPNNTLPYIKIVEPSSLLNFSEGSNVIIKTSSNDKNGKVVKVEFFVDGKSIGYNIFQPFSWVWFNASAGKHEIKAVATDNNGGKSISEIVEININN